LAALDDVEVAGDMETRIYMLDMTLPEEKISDGLFKEAQCLSQQRQKKIRALRFGKDRLLSLGAGILLKIGLERYGISEREAVICLGEHGKPYLRDYPNLHFNLSHSGSMVMAAFSDVPVGCDVEKIGEARLPVAHRFFAPEELKRLEQAPPGEERNRLFFRFWTLKESVLKATGNGMTLPMDSFTIIPGEPVSICGGTYDFCEYNLPEYQAALCRKTDVQGAGDIFFSFQKMQDVI